MDIAYPIEGMRLDQFGIGGHILDLDRPSRKYRTTDHVASAHRPARAIDGLHPLLRQAAVSHDAKCLALWSPNDGTLCLAQSLRRCHDRIQDRLHLVG